MRAAQSRHLTCRHDRRTPRVAFSLINHSELAGVVGERTRVAPAAPAATFATSASRLTCVTSCWHALLAADILYQLLTCRAWWSQTCRNSSNVCASHPALPCNPPPPTFSASGLLLPPAPPPSLPPYLLHISIAAITWRRGLQSLPCIPQRRFVPWPFPPAAHSFSVKKKIQQRARQTLQRTCMRFICIYAFCVHVCVCVCVCVCVRVSVCKIPFSSKCSVSCVCKNNYGWICMRVCVR